MKVVARGNKGFCDAQVMRKKAKPGKGGRGAAPKMLTKIEPVPSFFNFFSPPQV